MTEIHTRVSLRDKMWESIFPVRSALEKGGAGVSHDTSLWTPSPHLRTTPHLLSLLSSGQTTAPLLPLLWNEIFMAEIKRMQLKDCVYLSVCRLHRWDHRSRLGVQGWLFAMAVRWGGRGREEKKNQWIRTSRAARGKIYDRVNVKAFRKRDVEVWKLVSQFKSTSVKEVLMRTDCRFEHEIRGLGFSISVNLKTKRKRFAFALIPSTAAWKHISPSVFAFVICTCLIWTQKLLLNFYKVKLSAYRNRSTFGGIDLKMYSLLSVRRLMCTSHGCAENMKILPETKTGTK